MNLPAPIYIGVDPAFRQGGFWAAILDATDKTLVFKGFKSVLHWHDWLRSCDAPASCIICVENSNMQNKSFDMAGTKNEIAKKSRNAGCNQAVSQLAFDSAVDRYGKRFVFEVSPKDKGAKITDMRIFAGLMKQEGILLPAGTTNQDQRDAAKLVLIGRQLALRAGLFSTNRKQIKTPYPV